MEGFVIVINGSQALAIITKLSILDDAVVLDPPLQKYPKNKKKSPDINYILKPYI